MNVHKHTLSKAPQFSADAHNCTNPLADFRPPLTEMELHRAIRLPEVLRMTGMSRSAWYALLNPRLPTYDHCAPQPFKLGKSTRSPSAWWVWEVLAYLQAKSDARRGH